MDIRRPAVRLPLVRLPLVGCHVARCGDADRPAVGCPVVDTRPRRPGLVCR